MTKPLKSVFLIFFCLFSVSVLAQEAKPIAVGVNEAPVHFILDDHIYLPAIVDSTNALNLVFDTGAGGQLIVDTIYAKRKAWQMPNMKQAKVAGANGTTSVNVSMAKHSVKTEASVTTYNYLILMGIRDILGRHADGIMGSKDFADHPYEINYQHKFLRGLNAIPDSVKKTYQCIPLVVKNKKYLIQANVWFNGKCIEGLYNIDTGSGNVIDFTAETTQNYALEDYKGITHTGHGLQMGVGDGGISTWKDALADSMQIDNLNIYKPEITFHPSGKGVFDKNIFVGNIGAGILKNFNLVFDVPNGKLYLRPFKVYKHEEKSYGMNWFNRTDKGKGWIVRSLYDGSPAYKAGIKLGDTITEVNGKKVENYSWDEELQLTGNKMTLRLNTNNGPITVTIKKEKLY